ncbi:hypothetical protein BGW80DRAFT_1559588 [Lactifluus volemus]|nr:hypothetical protein BGW80DRAFT_1559588 [Lactifluus volemus]
MVNFQDPRVVLYEAVVLVKLWHTFYGIFFWEFVTTLDFEWSVIRGHRPYRWTIWIYSLTRMTAFMAVIFNIIGFAFSRPINCKVLVILSFLFSSFAIILASLLIMIRVYVSSVLLYWYLSFGRKADGSASIAIWNRDKFIMALAASIWGSNFGFLIHAVVQLQFAWVPEEHAGSCTVLNPDVTKLIAIVSFVTEIILLLMMLAGLLRLRMQGGGMLNLGSFLWKQGIIWISLSIMSGVPPVVFQILNLNEPLNFMFEAPAFLAVTIAATRIYRSLTHFSSNTILSSALPNFGLSFAKVGISDPSWIAPSTPIHVTVHTIREHSQLSQETHLSSQVNMDAEQQRVKVNDSELRTEEDINGNLNDRVEKVISDVESPV